MGHTTYSSTDRMIRSTSLGYDTKTVNEIFTARNINNAMSPYGIKVREARDSEAHPNSIAIIIALDVTGSMGSVPHHLVKEGLPNLVDRIIKAGILDPSILFLAIGDHECDQSPLQVGQFESGDAELDKWLTDTYLEGGGGGNAGESYMLAWYFAAQHTAIDCFEKRGQKGFLFTIGDEPVLPRISTYDLKKIMGDGQYENYESSTLYDKAREMYNVKHINIGETYSGGRQRVMDGWRELLSDNFYVAERHTEVATIIANCVVANVQQSPSIEESVPEEMML